MGRNRFLRQAYDKPSFPARRRERGLFLWVKEDMKMSPDEFEMLQLYNNLNLTDQRRIKDFANELARRARDQIELNRIRNSLGPIEERKLCSTS